MAIRSRHLALKSMLAAAAFLSATPAARHRRLMSFGWRAPCPDDWNAAGIGSLDRECPGPDDLAVEAIVNWFCISDVNELLDGPHMKSYAVQWLGATPDLADAKGEAGKECSASAN